MPFASSLSPRASHFLFALIFSLALINCGGPAVKDQSPVGAESNINISLESITSLLEDADSQSPSQRTFIYLNVTQALIDADEIDWARSTLSKLSARNISDEHYIRYSVLAATLAVAEGKPLRAKAHLWHDRINSLESSAPKSEVANLYEVRAQLLAGIAEYRASVEQRIKLHTILDEGTEESERNQDVLWLTLMELPLEDLKLESQIQNEMLPRGWYTLATLSKNNQTNLSQQIQAVDNWMLRWPEHPASLRLPADLQLLKQLERDRPNNIAILLPFSGRFETAAKAIRDGIMAAYYQAGRSSNHIPNIRMYDTADRNIVEVLDEAVLQGAELILGPLEQEKIVDLSMLAEMPVPVLALNRMPEEMPAALGLFQFGLPLEDEARQVADQAWKDGHRRAMVLAPATTSGDRAVQSFNERWLELGGELTKDYRYKDQTTYLDLVKSAVKVDESQDRRRRVRDIIGQNVEFEPRRRQDIDFIFLYSQASQARQIKPILAFHYAGDIPVYSIKEVYNGKLDTKNNKDLNDIRFTTLPWFFDRDLPEKEAINAHSSTINYQFLYALGVDAYHVHPRLRQLQSVAQASYYGSTGKLSMDKSGRFVREQVWAVFERGKAVPVVTFSQEGE